MRCGSVSYIYELQCGEAVKRAGAAERLYKYKHKHEKKYKYKYVEAMMYEVLSRIFMQ